MFCNGEWCSPLNPFSDRQKVRHIYIRCVRSSDGAIQDQLTGGKRRMIQNIRNKTWLCTFLLTIILAGVCIFVSADFAQAQGKRWGEGGT